MAYRVPISPFRFRFVPPLVYQFKIDLVGVVPKVWRRIQVLNGFGFFALHSAIMDVMGWTGCSPFRFEKFSARPDVEVIMSPLNGSVPSYEHDCLVKNYFTRSGETAKYVYGSAGQWEFMIGLELVFPLVEGVLYPVCVDGEQGGPPENIGGVEAFQSHFEIVTDPNHPLQQCSVDLFADLGYSDSFNPKAVVFRKPRQRFEWTHGL